MSRWTEGLERIARALRFHRPRGSTFIQRDLQRQIRMTVEKLQEARRMHRLGEREMAREELEIGTDILRAKNSPWLDVSRTAKELLRRRQALRQERRRLRSDHRQEVAELQDQLFILLRQFEALEGRGRPGQ